MNQLKMLGYWYSEREPLLPHPSIFVDENFDLEVRKLVIRYLKISYPIRHYRGHSFCRFKCSHPTPGTSDNSDGEYMFPSGYIHYVAFHNVKPPQEFIEKVIRNKLLIDQTEKAQNNIVQKLLLEKELKKKLSEEYKIDSEWWLKQIV